MLANSSEAKKRYRIPVENANSRCSQTARKPENRIEPLPKCETQERQKPKISPKTTPNGPPKAPGSPKQVLPYFLIQTLKGNLPKNDLRENPENKPNENLIPTKRLKLRIRYEIAAKMQQIEYKTNARITENIIFVEPFLKSRLLTAVLCTNVHSHRCLAHTVFDKCCEIRIKITQNTPKKPKRPQNGPDTENVMKPQ